MKTHRGRRRLLAMVGALLVWAAALVSADAARAATETVNEVGTSFQPAQREIFVGDKVIWTNRSNTRHTVTFQNGPDLHPTCARGGLLGPVGDCQEPGSTVEYTFTAARNYTYYCKLHDGMTGVIVVSPAVATTATTAPPTSTTRRSTTTTTRATSSTTSTTRALATSSTLASSTTTTTTEPASSVLLPGDPPPFSGEGSSSSATGDAGGADDGGDSATVALIVALLLAVSAGGGYLLWRLRPGRV